MKTTVALVLLLAGCGGQGRPGEGRPAVIGAVSSAQPRLSAFFPPSDVREMRVDHHEDHTALVADGNVYASSGDDVPTMIAAGLLPLVVHPGEPQALRCAVIGLGSGVEASTLAALGCASVDVYESRDDVFASAAALGRWMDSRLNATASQPPFRVLREHPAPDARYDVIVQSPGSAVIHRVHRLFVAERLAQIASHLAPGGVFVQHVQLYEIQPAVHRRMMRTLAEVFHELAVFAPDSLSSDTLVVASNAPIGLDLRRAELLMNGARTAYLGRAMRLRSPYDLLARLLLSSRDEVLHYAAGAPPYALAQPMAPHEVELRPRHSPPSECDAACEQAQDAERERFAARFPEEFLAAFYGDEWPYGDACRGWPSACELVRLPPSASQLDLTIALLGEGRYTRATAMLERAQAAGMDVGAVVEVAVDMLDRGRSVAFDPLSPALRADLAGEIQAAWDLRARDPSGAAERLRALRARASSPEAIATVRAALGAVLLDVEGGEDAYESLRALSEEQPSWCDARPACWHVVGRAALIAGHPPEAAWSFARYHALTTGWPAL